MPRKPRSYCRFCGRGTAYGDKACDMHRDLLRLDPYTSSARWPERAAA